MKEKILESIRENDTIIIHRHVRPDPDALGSQGSLAEIIKESFPEKRVYIVGEEDPSLTFLVKMDSVEDEIYQDALVIVCDTANTDRISDERYPNGKQLIKIDHHPNIDQYGDFRWVDTEASSVSEMIYEFYLFGKDKGLKLNKRAATLIYAGIVGDTGRFLFANTKSKTVRYAAELLDYDFDFIALYHQLYEMESNKAKLKGYILQEYHLSKNGAAYIKISEDILNKFQVTPDGTSQIVSTLADIKGINAWVMFVEEAGENRKIRVRLRSKGPVINKVARMFNGGGHPLASGATVYSWEEADALIEELDKVCREFSQNSD